jgi:hypothetical protein
MKSIPIRIAFALCTLWALAPGQLSAQDHRTWYLAEGATYTFEQEILVANPNGVAAIVHLDLLLDNGTTEAVHGIVVPAFSRRTIRVNDFPQAANRALSARAASDRPILIERSMYWGGPGRRGGHNAAGVMEPGTEWHFAEGSLGMFQTYLLIGNPGQTMALVQVRYLTAAGDLFVDNLHVMPGERRTIPVNQWQPDLGTAFAMHVTSDQPVLAERAMYWHDFGGGHASVGVRQPLMIWRFAEGSTLDVVGFLTFVLLSNPGTTDATVHVTFYRDGGGAAVTKHVTVGARSRLNIFVNDDPDLSALANSSFSFVVESSNVPIVAERAMYWGNFVEGHVTAGAEQEATAWGFAEGLEDRHGGLDYDTYFLFVNANPAPITITGTFYREDGRGLQRNITIPANSRYTWATRDIPQLSNQRFAAFFQSSSLPFVAERAVYWGVPYRGGHVSVGTPWTAAIAPPSMEPDPNWILGVNPGSGPNDGGYAATISGGNFTAGTRVFFGNTEAHVVNLTATSISVVVPGNPAGASAIRVRGSYGADSVRGDLFSYFPAAPPPPPPPPPGTANGPSIATYPASRAFPIDYFGVVAQLAAQRPDLLHSSCGNNEFMYQTVRRLRAATGSNRWGLNWKRGIAGDLSHDIVTYYWGPEGVSMEGRPEVYIIDIIFGHCGPNPGPAWQDLTQVTYGGGSIGRWTEAGRNLN